MAGKRWSFFLGARGRPERASVQELVAALGGDDPAARVDAARVLDPGAEGAPRDDLLAAASIVAPALSRSTEDEDAVVRKWASWSLASFVAEGGVPAEDAVERIAERLADPERAVRLFAAAALERIGPPAAATAERLSDRVTGDPSREVRTAAKRALRAVRRRSP